MIKRALTFGLGLIVLGSMIGIACGPHLAIASAAQGGIGRVRFVHAAPATAALQIYVDDTRWAAIQPRASMNYQNIPAGAHTVSFRLTEASDALISVAVAVAADQRLTVAVLDGSDGPVAEVYTDDVSAPARNSARLTVIHAVPDAGAISVEVDSVLVADDLTYGEVARGYQVFDGSHDIALIVDGAAQPLSGAVRALTGNRTYALFIVGSAATGEYEVILAESSVLRPTQNSQFRVAHLARGIGDVAVYINHEDVPIFPQVRFSRVTQYYTTGLGPHTIEVYPLGAPRVGQPLARGTADIGPDEHVLFVLQGEAENLTVVTYTSDLAPVGAGYGRLQVINAAVDNPAFITETLEGQPLFEALAVGETGNRVVPAGAYNIRFSDAATGTMMMEKTGIQVAPGTVRVLLAFDDDPLVSLVNVVPVQVDGVPQAAMLRWAHFASAQAPVDVYLNDAPIILGLAYGVTLDYVLYTAENAALRVFLAGADPAVDSPLINERLNLARLDGPRTILLLNSVSGLQISTIRDDLTWLSPDRVRLRFVNAARGASNVFVQRPNGITWVDTLGMGAASVYLSIDPAESIAFDWVLVGQGVINEVKSMPLEPGMEFTVFLIGDVLEPASLETVVWAVTP